MKAMAHSRLMLTPRQLDAIIEALTMRLAGEIIGEIRREVYQHALDKMQKALMKQAATSSNATKPNARTRPP
jgi:hypothetical protein